MLGCPWQRCTVHFLRETLGHVRKEQQGMVAALLRPIFNADDGERRAELVGDALERLRKPLPKVAALLDDAEEDLLAFYAFPADHWPKLRSTNPLERVNREIGRRTDVVGRSKRGRRGSAATSATAGSDPQRYKKDNTREEAKELTAA